MNKFQSFQEFLVSQSVDIPLLDFAINILGAIVLSHILGLLFIKYGRSLSNRREMARNFVMITATTTLIIAIVKSSLALSLGLVGALSIVRFRAAIKEPEELAYLFLSISIGLGFGADQRLVTVVALAIIILILVIRAKFETNAEEPNMIMTLAGGAALKEKTDDIINVLQQNCRSIKLRRLDETDEIFEMTVFVDFANFADLEKSKSRLREIDETIKISFIDNSGSF